MKNVLFVVGSFRAKSFNRQLAREAEKLLAPRCRVDWLDFADIPFMNQDIEDPAPAAVARVREAVRAADGVWFFTPEYNFSYPPADCRAKLADLLAFVKAEQCRDRECGFAVEPEAWTTDDLALPAKQRDALAAQAAAFADFLERN